MLVNFLPAQPAAAWLSQQHGLNNLMGPSSAAVQASGAEQAGAGNVGWKSGLLEHSGAGTNFVLFQAYCQC